MPTFPNVRLSNARATAAQASPRPPAMESRTPYLKQKIVMNSDTNAPTARARETAQRVAWRSGAPAPRARLGDRPRRRSRARMMDVKLQNELEPRRRTKTCVRRRKDARTEETLFPPFRDCGGGGGRARRVRRGAATRGRGERRSGWMQRKRSRSLTARIVLAGGGAAREPRILQLLCAVSEPDRAHAPEHRFARAERVRRGRGRRWFT